MRQDPDIAPKRGLLTSLAGWWVTIGVGRLGRTVIDVAAELGCNSHTVNKRGQPLRRSTPQPPSSVPQPALT